MKNNSKKNILITSISAIIFVIGLIAFFVFKKGNPESNSFSDSSNGNREGQILSEEFKNYSNTKYGFSINIPKNSEEKTIEDDGGEALVFQGGPGEFSFQIYITPFSSDEEVITSSMIKEDLPGIKIEEPKEAIIGDDIRALIFITDNPGVGRTREAWFIKRGHLYQVTTFIENDSLLAGVLSTLDFK